MGLGKLFRTAPPAVQQSRMLVSDGWRLGPSEVLGAGEGWWGSNGYLHALHIPGVDRAVNLISDLLGSLPWDAYTTHGKDHAEKLDPRPVLLEQPNPEEPRVSTFSAWAVDLLLYGNAFAVIVERNAQGTPTALAPVAARNVGVRRVNGTTYSPLPVGAVEYLVGGRSFAADEVLHVKGLTEPGLLRGYGVLERHFHGHGALDLASDLARQARSVTANGGVPTGLLKAMSPDVTKDQLTDAKAAWLNAQRDRTVAALGPGTDFVPLAWTPEDSQLLEARKFSLLEIANLFGLPPRFVGASSGDSMTYSNSETESIDLIKFSLGGHLARFEQSLSLLFPHGTQVKANLDALLRADTTARYGAHETGIRAGFLLRSESRSIEDLPPVKGIDDQPDTAAEQLKINKMEPVTDPAIMQPHQPQPPTTPAAVVPLPQPKKGQSA